MTEHQQKPFRPRIAIYGTGQFGQHIVRMAHDKGWPIVAAYNRAGEKVGQDVGRLSGLDTDLGVVVEDCDTADFSQLDADVAIVAMTVRLAQDMPAYRRLLGAGVNVISHAAEAYLPFSCDATLAAEIDQLAKDNGVSFTGTGIWDMSRIWSGLLVCGGCTDINGLSHYTLTDASRNGKPVLIQSGMGEPVETFDSRLKQVVKGMYCTIPEHVLMGLGYTVTSVSETVDPIVVEKPFYNDVMERTLEPGQVCGMTMKSTVETKQGLTATSHIDIRLFYNDDDVEYMAWEVTGKPSATRIRVERDDSAYATAAMMLNRIPDVINASPGIQLVSELGPLRSTALL